MGIRIFYLREEYVGVAPYRHDLGAGIAYALLVSLPVEHRLTGLHIAQPEGSPVPEEEDPVVLSLGKCTVYVPPTDVPVWF